MTKSMFKFTVGAVLCRPKNYIPCRDRGVRAVKLTVSLDRILLSNKMDLGENKLGQLGFSLLGFTLNLSVDW